MLPLSVADIARRGRACRGLVPAPRATGGSPQRQRDSLPKLPLGWGMSRDTAEGTGLLATHLERDGRRQL